MEESFGPFLDALYTATEYSEGKFPEFIVVTQVVNELEKHAKTGETLELRIDAKRALRFLKMDKRGKRLIKVERVRGVEDFADAAIQSLMTGLRINNKILLITQDKTLTDDIKKLNSLDSQHGRYLSVYKVDPESNLVENKGNVYSKTPAPRASGHLASGKPLAAPVRKETPSEKPTPKAVEQAKDNARKDKAKALPAIPSEILALDRAISSNVRNQTYPLARKLDDIDRQLKNLKPYESSLISSWKLLYGIDDLLEAKGELIDKQGKLLEEPETPKAKEEDKSSSKAEMAKSREPGKTPEPAKKRLPYGKGDTFIAALKDLMSRNGAMIRDPDIPYVKAVHGPYDLVTSDFTKLVHEVALLPVSSTREATVKNVNLHIEKNPGDYRVSLEENKVETVNDENPAQKPAQEVKKTASVPKAKPASPKKEAKPSDNKGERKEAKGRESHAQRGRKLVHSENYDAAVKADRDLKSKINNPAYPREAKIKDIEEQEARVRTLKQSELKDLTYTIRGLQKAIKDVRSAKAE